MPRSVSPPYKYVSIEGPATIGEPDLERDVRQGPSATWASRSARCTLPPVAAQPEPAVLVSVKPAHWFSVDYTKMG